MGKKGETSRRRERQQNSKQATNKRQRDRVASWRMEDQHQRAETAEQSEGNERRTTNTEANIHSSTRPEWGEVRAHPTLSIHHLTSFIVVVTTAASCDNISCVSCAASSHHYRLLLSLLCRCIVTDRSFVQSTRSSSHIHSLFVQSTVTIHSTSHPLFFS
jgi:hypothetical protein